MPLSLELDRISSFQNKISKIKMSNHLRYQEADRSGTFLWILVALFGLFFLSSCGGEDSEQAEDNGMRPLIAEGVKLMEDMKFDDAKIPFQELMNRDPNDLEAMSYYAVLMSKSGRMGDAVKYAEKVLEADPNWALPHVALSRVYYSSSNFDKAVKHARTALKIDPNSGGAYLVIGEIYLRRGKVKESLPVLKKGVELNPKDTDGYKKLAAAQIKNGEHKVALETLHKAMEINPDVPGVHFNLALVYDKLKDGDKALHHIDRAEQLYLAEDNTRWANKTRHTKRVMARNFGMSPDNLGQ
ncbi:hypothetical protein UR09_01735 [Candidatus Nitromaritima sp. SCGC AAA799-A02]|nr:hypothetical protein UR09_01735 [Candidatus Nitromaritima sp. SCGC AAA799-A02]